MGRKTKVSIRRSDNVKLAEDLHDKTGFSEDEFPHGHIFWIGKTSRKLPVCFCSVSIVDEDTVFMSRAGVMKAQRGQGLHNRMIKIRERFARRNGYKWVITYTMKDNPNSFVHLIKNNYEIYLPEYEYAGNECMYFRKRINN